MIGTGTGLVDGDEKFDEVIPGAFGRIHTFYNSILGYYNPECAPLSVSFFGLLRTALFL